MLRKSEDFMRMQIYKKRIMFEIGFFLPKIT